MLYLGYANTPQTSSYYSCINSIFRGAVNCRNPSGHTAICSFYVKMYDYMCGFCMIGIVYLVAGNGSGTTGSISFQNLKEIAFLSNGQAVVTDFNVIRAISLAAGYF